MAVRILTVKWNGNLGEVIGIEGLVHLNSTELEDMRQDIDAFLNREAQRKKRIEKSGQ